MSSPRAEPIAIEKGHGRRPRSMSLSSTSSNSAPSSPELTTPSASFSAANAPPSTSPIMSFLAQAQKSPGSATFPFRRPWQNPVFEEAEEDEVPVSPNHVRRASTQAINRFTQPSTSPTDLASGDRGTGLLRRLSIGGPTLVRPPTEGLMRSGSPPRVPPNSAVSPTPTLSTPTPKGRAPRRSATISLEKPRRAPSPMGERILKGHFDGFN
ncbi:hypothetical protein DL96DRAFT_1552700 [Flagelloscypha sp. PMI_526]|nr:hypothetical protein DL96DRAFT_1552700 [Flagelloscypha sp. PMI_526]